MAQGLPMTNKELILTNNVLKINLNLMFFYFRTRQERGLEPATPEGAKFGTIDKSRYDSISSYLSDCSLRGDFNDVELKHDPESYKILKEAGINELVARHVSHLFIR